MFVGITGSLCGGRESVADYLIREHGFVRLYVVPNPTHALTGQAEDGNKGDAPLFFTSVEDLLEHVTKHWQKNWVTTYLPNEKILDQFSRRPFFLLVSVDAPLAVRWERYQTKRSRSRKDGICRDAGPNSASSSLSKLSIGGTPATSQLGTNASDYEEFGDALPDQEPTTLEQFVLLSDTDIYDPVSGKQLLMSRATVRLVNSSASLSHFYDALAKVDLLNEDRLRPSWDTYFMALASLAAHRSNCMKRRVGCVIVRDKRVISTGYNGTPRGLPNCAEGGCPRCNQGQGSGHGLATCLCLHAEENALLEAGRDRIHGSAVLYCDTCPCLTCSIKIVQAGIQEVVYSQEYSMDGDTATVFMKAGVKFRKLAPPANGHIHLERMDVGPLAADQSQ